MGIATASPVMFRSVAGAASTALLAALLQRLAPAAPGGITGPALAAAFAAAAAVSLLGAWAACGLPAQLPPAAARPAPGGGAAGVRPAQ